MLLVLALRLAAAAGASRPSRAGGAVLAYAAIVAVLLAASRAGVAAAVLGVALWLWLRRDRVEAALLALAAVRARRSPSRPGRSAGRRSSRTASRAPTASPTAPGSACCSSPARRSSRSLALELERRPLAPAQRRTVGRALAGAGGRRVARRRRSPSLANAGRVADEFRGGEVTNDPGRFGSLSSNNRLAWWGEALATSSRRDPLAGAGANTFEVARKRYRETASAVSQPHSVPLQFLAGTGLVGLALFLRSLRRRGGCRGRRAPAAGGGERDAAAALAVALALWLVHALVDYDWDFVAVTGPVLFAAGVLAAAGRPPRRARGPLAAVASRRARAGRGLCRSRRRGSPDGSCGG